MLNDSDDEVPIQLERVVDVVDVVDVVHDESDDEDDELEQPGADPDADEDLDEDDYGTFHSPLFPSYIPFLLHGVLTCRRGLLW